MTKDVWRGAWDMAEMRPRARDSFEMGGRYTYLGRAPLLFGRRGSALALHGAPRGFTHLVLGRAQIFGDFWGLRSSLF